MPDLGDGERALEAIELDELALGDRARAIIGVVGRRERIPFGAVLLASGTGWYPVLALCGLAFADAVVAATFGLQLPEIRRSMGTGALNPFDVYWLLFLALAAVPAAAVVARRSRPRMARVATAGAALAALLAAAVTSGFAMVLAVAAAALASGVLVAVLVPLLFDSHRPEIRVRVMATYAAAVMAGIGLAGVVVAVAGGNGLSWRGCLLLAAVPAALATAASRWVVDPGRGRHDRDRVAHIVEEQLGASPNGDVPGSGLDVSLGTWEQFRRVTAGRAAPATLALALVFGMFARGLPQYLDVFLRDRWGLVAATRTLVYAVLCVASLVGLAWFATRAEQALRESMGCFLRLSSAVVTGTAVLIGAAVVAPIFILAVVLLGLAFTGFAVMLVAAVTCLLTITDPVRRPHAAVLVGVAVAAGGVLGHLVIATIGNRFGTAWGLEAFAAVVLAAATSVGSAAVAVDGDVDRLVGRIVETDELRVRVGQGQHVPLLSCRHVDFCYGPVQVLFDVSLTVDDGEMVALLGTNGAGKSTLLRLISGLGFPAAGSIHYRGADITFVDTDRRVQLGITQVPGGRAVFGSMSVVDNLRAFGYTLGTNRPRLERGIEEAFRAFPRLAERRNQLAATLSGGEQQMLGLAKTFLLEPRLLLIDELSLGLAPLLVAELLDMVRRINERGTAVVLVEQSVNVALSVVDHAYFMERGEICFDGDAPDLLARRDLLRSVFLEGATKGMTAEARP